MKCAVIPPCVSNAIVVAALITRTNVAVRVSSSQMAAVFPKKGHLKKKKKKVTDFLL